MAEALSGGSYHFPKLTEKNKDKDYHKRFAQAIVHKCIDDTYSTNYSIMAECYKFFSEGSSGELTSHLQQAPDGTALPIPWLTLNTIKTKVNLLLGELEERGYEIKVKALNPEATSRKLEEKEKLRVQRKLAQLVSFVEETAGVQLEDPEQYIPQTENELSEYFDLTFKDKAELIMETALKYLADRNYWTEERKMLFRDLIIVGRVFVKNEIVRGVPRSRRIDPLCFIHDQDCQTDTLEDATYFGEIEYLPLASAAERYNLSNEEIEEVYNSYQNYLGMGAKNYQVLGAQDYFHDFGAIAGNRLKWFKELDGELKILVIRACWRDYRDYNYKEETNKYGIEHLQEITRIRKRDESNIKTKKFEVWRQATLVGGRVIREWGECPNQARDLSDLEKTEPPYKAWIPDFAVGRGVSMVEQLAHLQLMKDIAMYNMNHVMTTQTGGKTLIYDLAMVPEGWTPEQMMKYMNVFKVAFVNSKESQLMPGGMNLFREVDMGLSQAISQYVDIMRFYDSEMDKISGVSQERQGIAPPASQTATATQAVIMGSNLVTAPLFKGFERFCSKVLNHQAKLVKIVFPKSPELFAPIIGDVGVDFLREHIDLDLDEFGVAIQSLPPEYISKQKLDQLVMMAVQADPELLSDAMRIITEPDFKVAMRIFNRKFALRKVYQAQQEQAMAERDQAMQAQMTQMQAQMQQAQIDGKLQEATIKGQDSLQRTLAQGRTKLGQEKIKQMFK